jgi:ABC-2 type transport system ATP-binding protein
MAEAIVAENLGRYFGEIKAVDGISFVAKRGDVLGFLGPNGAGKSTTMKMLTGFLAPSFGTARINGADIVTDSLKVRSSIGYLPESAPLYGEMSVRDFLEFIAEIRGVDRAKRKAAIAGVVELTALGGVLSQRIDTLSKGFKRRVGLAQALVHDPEILILDEPTDGLDPNQKHDVRTLINSMAKEKCIVLSTHILEEVDACCNRVVIVARGKVVVDETPESLKRRSPSYGAVTVSLSASDETAVSQLQGVPGVARAEQLSISGAQRTVKLYPKQGAEIVHEVLKKAESARWSVDRFEVDGGQLDEVFRQITG